MRSVKSKRVRSRSPSPEFVKYSINVPEKQTELSNKHDISPEFQQYSLATILESEMDAMIQHKIKSTKDIKQTKEKKATPASANQTPDMPKIPIETVNAVVDWHYNPISYRRNRITINTLNPNEGKTSEDTFNAMVEEVINFVSINDCGQVNNDYIEEQLPKANAIAILTFEDDILGFASVYFVSSGLARKPHSIYIDILCGHSKYSGIGTRILDEVANYAQEHNIRKIQLSAIDDAVGFYIKKGFTCNPCKMEYSVTSKRSTSRVQSEKQRKNKGKHTRKNK